MYRKEGKPKILELDFCKSLLLTLGWVYLLLLEEVGRVNLLCLGEETNYSIVERILV